MAQAKTHSANSRHHSDDADKAPVEAILKLPDGHQITYNMVGGGERPLMLFVIGSSGLGSLYKRLAAELSSQFRCAYYDKRGFLPAKTDAKTADEHNNQYVSAGQNADDAAALLRHISPQQSAFVFGTSTGATAVLDLATRYPGLIHTAVLHEPITFSVMPASELKEEILALYRSLPKFRDPLEGSKAFADYMFHPNAHTTAPVLNRSKTEQEEGHAEPERQSKPAARSVELFNARQGRQEGAAMLAYEVDIQRARILRDSMILIRGRESREWPISQPVKALANVLTDSTAIWEVPGDHLSFAARRNVAVFAKELVDLLQQEGRMPAFKKERQTRL